ncbi:MAG: hypothetical protein ACTSVY_01380 [Candidatus Helarchaeota archaeon]
MLKKIKKLSEKVSERLLMSYIIAISVGTVLFLIVMFMFNWNLIVFISLPFFLFFTTISGMTMKFLGGLGMSMTYATICIFFFKILSKKMKGKKKFVDGIKVTFTILALIICAYGVYVFISGLFQHPLTFIERITSLILGMFSLTISVYLIPMIRDIYRPFSEESMGDKLKGKFKRIKYSLWKGYKSKIKKDYLSVEAAEYEHLKDNINDFRAELSAILLIPMAFILTLFLPLIGVVIVVWLRLFSLDKKPFSNYERVVLLIIISAILIISTIIFLFITIYPIIPFFNASYAFGIWFSIGMFLYLLYKR